MKKITLAPISLPEIVSKGNVPKKSAQKSIGKLFFKGEQRTIENEKPLVETETDREIKVLEKSYPKTVDKEYIHKLCNLLKRRDTNYLAKRENIQDTCFNLDDNNNLYLTLPKLDLKPKKVEPLSSNIKILNDLHANDDDSDLSELNEEEQKALFEKLRTKNKFNEPQEKSKSIDSRNNPRNLNRNKSRNTQILPVYMEIPTIQEIIKLRAKTRMIRKLKENENENINNNPKQKQKLHPVDLFHYNKKKWIKIKKEEENKMNALILRRKKILSDISTSISELKSFTASFKKTIRRSQSYVVRRSVPNLSSKNISGVYERD